MTDGKEHLDAPEPLQVIIDNNEAVENNLETLDLTLEENLHRAERPIAADSIIKVFIRILTDDVDSEETAETLSYAILYIIRHYYVGDFDELPDSLKDWFKKCNIKYEAELDESLTYGSLGPTGWVNINTEVVIKDESYSPKFKHTVNTIESKAEFTSSPEGLVNLIHHLIDQLEEGIRFDVVTEEQVDSITEEVSKLNTSFEKEQKKEEALRDMIQSEISEPIDSLGDHSEEEIYERLVDDMDQEEEENHG